MARHPTGARPRKGAIIIIFDLRRRQRGEIESRKEPGIVDRIKHARNEQILVQELSHRAVLKTTWMPLFPSKQGTAPITMR
jgi:RecB family exonuclease